MLNSWIVLLPPFIVFFSVFVTQRLNVSLFLGILSAAAIVGNFNPISTFKITAHRLVQQASEIDYLYLYGFLLILGMIIVLLSYTGGANAFARNSAKKLKSRKSVETTSLILSSLLFVDDYLSNLTAGYVMRPLSDKFNIARAKLAFLVHALSSPLVIIAPISSWVAMITSQLETAGISQTANNTTKIIGDPFFIYLSSIPFTFYSFLIIFSVWLIVRSGLSYGPMEYHEYQAETNNNLFGGKNPLTSNFKAHEHKEGALIDLILPIVILIGSAFGGMLYAGGYWMFGGQFNVIQALQNNHDTFLVFLTAAVVTFISSCLWAICRQILSLKEIPDIITEGIQLMYPAVLMIFLASTLGTILKDDLFVGGYLANLMLGKIGITTLPLVFFVISLLIAAITGSSWGTIALLLPITIQMIVRFLNITTPIAGSDIAILYPVLGAIFSGAVCGNHISPISDTTIMASTSTGTYPIDHAYTQLPYILPTIISCCLSFYLVGIFVNYQTMIRIAIPLLAGIVTCSTLLYSFQAWYPSVKNRS